MGGRYFSIDSTELESRSNLSKTRELDVYNEQMRTMPSSFK